MIGGILLALVFFANEVFLQSSCAGVCPEIGVGDKLFSFFSSSLLLKVLVVYFITGFVTGVFFGWLYGKISTRGGFAFGGKNRKSDSSIPNL